MPGIGVDTEHYSPEATSLAEVESVRAEFGMGEGVRYLLMVGEFIARKRHADLLRAFAQMSRRDGSLRLLLAGQGPLMARSRALAGELGLSGTVHFAGQRLDVRALIAGSVALVLPSKQEGLPRCVLEAMSMGVPVVATRIRGTSELLEGGSGLLVEPGDIARLAAALSRVVHHEAWARSLGAEGRRRSGRYGLSRVVEAHAQLYARCLAEVAARRNQPTTDGCRARRASSTETQRPRHGQRQPLTLV